MHASDRLANNPAASFKKCHFIADPSVADDPDHSMLTGTNMAWPKTKLSQEPLTKKISKHGRLVLNSFILRTVYSLAVDLV